ncbi:MAG: class A beta-lactamase-related serine hydrolase [Elusimicrobiaceae bacterium]|nr:class A beta-lactamase-related serine hydrolase [Elusimicrobiaceae bacterium]
MNRQKIFYLAMLVAVGACACLLAGGMDFKAGRADDEAALEADAAGFDSEQEWTTNADKWREMTDRLARSAARFPGRMGVYIKDLKTGEEFSYHADELFPSASLVKVPVMAAVTKKIRNGEVNWNEKITITRNAKRGGSGHLRRVRSGTKLSVRDLMVKMITESDNTAAHLLIERVGYDYLQQEFRELGLERTNISPDGMSLCSSPVANENYTTPREMAMLVEKIYRGEVVDKDHSAIMLDIMKHTKGRSRFAKKLPRGFALAHKTGMLRLSCSDTGIVYSPQGEYVMAMLTWKVPDYKYAANYIAKMAAVTYKYYGKSGNLVVRARPEVAGNETGG